MIRNRYSGPGRTSSLQFSADRAEESTEWIETIREGSGIMVDRRSVEDGSFLADGLAGSIPPEVFGTGRVCIEPACTAKLSRYNSTEWCALHESPASTQRPFDTSTRQRGRRRNSSGTGRTRRSTQPQKRRRQTAA